MLSKRMRASTTSQTGVNRSNRDCRRSAASAASESQVSSGWATTDPCSMTPSARRFLNTLFAAPRSTSNSSRSPTGPSERPGNSTRLSTALSPRKAARSSEVTAGGLTTRKWIIAASCSSGPLLVASARHPYPNPEERNEGRGAKLPASTAIRPHPPKSPVRGPRVMYLRRPSTRSVRARRTRALGIAPRPTRALGCSA